MFAACCGAFLVWVSQCRSDSDDLHDDENHGCNHDVGLISMAKKIIRGGDNDWDKALYGLSFGGMLMIFVAVAAVCLHYRRLLRFYLMYIFSTLMFCVLYHIFQLDRKMSGWGYAMLGLAALMVVLIWTQLYYAMYFFRILDFYDV